MFQKSKQFLLKQYAYKFNENQLSLVLEDILVEKAQKPAKNFMS